MTRSASHEKDVGEICRELSPMLDHRKNARNPPEEGGVTETTGEELTTTPHHPALLRGK